MILLIDTSDNAQITLILLNQDQIKAKTWKSVSTASETLIENIKKFLKASKLTVSDLKKLAVVVGPGHFSRIRTGVATANAMALALKISVVGLKKSEISDLKPLLTKKGQKQVNVYYDRAPNITKAKPKKLKI